MAEIQQENHRPGDRGPHSTDVRLQGFAERTDKVREHMQHTEKRTSRFQRLLQMVNVPARIREGRETRFSQELRDEGTAMGSLHPENFIHPAEPTRVVPLEDVEPTKDQIVESVKKEKKWSRLFRDTVSRVAGYLANNQDTKLRQDVEPAPNGYVAEGILDNLEVLRQQDGHVSEYNAARGDNSIAVSVNARNYSPGGREDTQLGRKSFGLITLGDSHDVWALTREHVGRHHRDTVEIVKIDRETGRVDKRTKVTVNPDKSISIPFSTGDSPPIMVNASLDENQINLHALGDTKIHVLASPGAIVEREPALQTA